MTSVRVEYGVLNDRVLVSDSLNEKGQRMWRYCSPAELEAYEMKDEFAQLKRDYLSAEVEISKLKARLAAIKN